MSLHGGFHLQGGGDVNALHKRRRRQRDRTAYQLDVGAAFCGGGSNGKTHFAGTVVSDVTHRVQRLARRARGNHDVEMLQIVDRRKMGCGHINNRQRVKHAARANVAAGLAAAVRTPDKQAA